MENKFTYISLFSSAGIGCYGFKLEDFNCIATNELIERRLNVQKCNNKCKYDSGYICGDITKDETKAKLFGEINYWKKHEKIDNVDVVIATPPCQGMSVANLKKNNELNRNSLVIESIKIIKEIKPKIFVFENVSAFLKTACMDVDNNIKSIEQAINDNLSNNYVIMSRVINFKDYGSNSSRTRTLVIGVRNDFEDIISPIDLFPKKKKEKTLKDVIGKLKPLNNFGEIDENDIYHFFRLYPEHMREWIHDLKEGESAFDQKDDNKKPHTIIDGKIKINAQKTGDKYKRQYWDKVAPCIHTRNDQLASQNTIHPKDDRVFSIRELMNIMTIPKSFKWVDIDEKILNNYSYEEKRKFLKKEEINIRQSIGEAVPTEIFKQIAKNIKNNLSRKNYNLREINKIIKDNKLIDNGNLKKYIEQNKNVLSFTTLSKIAELSNAERNNEEAFYTNKKLLNYIYKQLPTINKKEIRILEPSVGVGNFIPYIISKYSMAEKLVIDVVDLNDFSLTILKELLKIIDIPENVEINYVNDDFLLHELKYRYDVITGNPPFQKLNSKNKKLISYRENAINKISTNTSSYFLEKAIKNSDNVVMVMPKFLLNTIEYENTRRFIENFNVQSIIDFGEKGFEGVLIETISISINTISKPVNTIVESITNNVIIDQKQKYIMDRKLPYWIIYRNKDFDNVFNKMDFGLFDVFRDRQITNNNTNKQNKGIWVIKSRNISDDGTRIEHISDYDQYIDVKDIKNYDIYNYLNNENIYLTPNMTYKPRVCKLPSNTIVNGSVAILIPHKGVKLNKKDMLFFSTNEYRDFYKIARNYQTRSLNIDKTSVFFFGKLRRV